MNPYLGAGSQGKARKGARRLFTEAEITAPQPIVTFVLQRTSLALLYRAQWYAAIK
jgi:hypothetical protein